MMHYLAFPIVSFLSVPLVLCSLPSHIRAGSVSIISLIVWLTSLSIIRGVDSIAWAGNSDIKLVVWCDITVRIVIGFTLAVPASALCILRHLEAVASIRSVHYGIREKRNRQIFEIIMCFGLPIILIALSYIVQGHRFDIVEDLGCSPAIYISIPAVVLLWVPPLIISCITMIYAILVLRHFLRHRISFASHLRNSQSAISPNRYFRLMALAIIEITWDTGMNIYVLWFNISGGLRPWTNWDDVHSNFSRIGRFPRFLLPDSLWQQYILQWWILPVSCVFFFIFFGFSGEALADYRTGISWVCRTIFRRDPFRTKPSKAVLLPIYTPHRAAAAISTRPATKPGSTKHLDELSIDLFPLDSGMKRQSISDYSISVSSSDSPSKVVDECSSSPTVVDLSDDSSTRAPKEQDYITECSTPPSAQLSNDSSTKTSSPHIDSVDSDCSTSPAVAQFPDDSSTNSPSEYIDSLSCNNHVDDPTEKYST
ncbi:hypothetical protein M422DRAFT_205956 [Sphaerobolus stellatus SS14]|nr:hypothetical protein M422DRAFT_205956 [Sphaerobolus stellatus SS14]